MKLTVQELREWQSYPATRAVIAEVERSIRDMRSRSALRHDSVEKTALATAYNEGWCEGAEAFLDAHWRLIDNEE